ncbi:MAG: FixH family protein [Phycisphaerales bacterium]|nr:FixH family protein [Phycisphaerales bacterium]
MRYFAIAALLFFPCALIAQTAPIKAPPNAKPETDAAAEHERQCRALAKSLENVVLRGVFQATNETGLRGEAPLTPPRPERYEIEGAQRVDGDRWIIRARIEFEGNVLTLPIYVNVEWAGDTPVITVNDLAIPGMQTYSARVMLYRGFYSGVWMGQSYGGVLSGQIIPRDKEAGIFGDTKAPEAPKDAGAPPLTTIKSADETYTVSYRTTPNPIPLNEIFSMEVLVAGPDLDKLELQVDADMPAHRHGMNTSPKVTRIALGKFRVEGMNLHMAGEWVIAFDLRRGSVIERAESEIELR